MNTPNLDIEPLVSAQAQKHVTVNEAFARVDAAAQLAVFDRDTLDPPAAPADGDRYLLPENSTGNWAGHDGEIAAWQDATGGWIFLTPRIGWRLWVIDESTLIILTDNGWLEAGGGAALNPASGGLVGVNTTADTINRLAVKSEAALFSHDDVTPGSGDMRLTLNKAAPLNDTSLTLQSSFSTRAQVGLTGDDDLHFKVSPDGSTFHESMVINKNNGEIDPVGGIRRSDTYVDVFRNGSAYNFSTGFATYVCTASAVNPLSHYNTSTGLYTVPEDGLYMILSKIRCDHVAADIQVGLGVHTDNSDGPWFQWGSTQAVIRNVFNYQRIVTCSQGQQLRLFLYIDGSTLNFYRAALQIYKISN